MVLSVHGMTTVQVAKRMKNWLQRVRDKLAERNLAVNSAKELVFARDKKSLNEWNAAQATYAVCYTSVPRPTNLRGIVSATDIAQRTKYSLESQHRRE